MICNCTHNWNDHKPEVTPKDPPIRGRCYQTECNCNRFQYPIGEESTTYTASPDATALLDN